MRHLVDVVRTKFDEFALGRLSAEPSPYKHVKGIHQYLQFQRFSSEIHLVQGLGTHLEHGLGTHLVQGLGTHLVHGLGNHLVQV